MNDILEHKGYCGTVEFSDADNVFFGQVIGIKGLISYEGNDMRELKNDFENAINDYLEICKEKNLNPEKTYKRDLIKVIPNFYS